MKKELGFLIAGLIIYTSSFCQKGSAYYSNYISEFATTMYDIVKKESKDELVLRRMETGTLSSDRNVLWASSQRMLFTGNQYKILAYLDTRVTDFVLKIYKENADGNYDLFKKINDRRRKVDEPDYEYLEISPEKSEMYKFEIEASNTNTSTTGRYGIMVWSKTINSDNSQAVSKKRSFSIDNYSVCEYNNSLKKYGDWGADVDYESLFEINAAETIITQTDKGGKATYYIQSKSSDVNYDYYKTVVNGVKYDFDVPINDKKYIRRIKVDSSNPNPPMIDYHIKSKWSE